MGIIRRIGLCSGWVISLCLIRGLSLCVRGGTCCTGAHVRALLRALIGLSCARIRGRCRARFSAARSGGFSVGIIRRIGFSGGWVISLCLIRGLSLFGRGSGVCRTGARVWGLLLFLIGLSCAVVYSGLRGRLSGAFVRDRLRGRLSGAGCGGFSVDALRRIGLGGGWGISLRLSRGLCLCGRGGGVCRTSVGGWGLLLFFIGLSYAFVRGRLCG